MRQQLEFLLPKQILNVLLSCLFFSWVIPLLFIVTFFFSLILYGFHFWLSLSFFYLGLCINKYRYFLLNFTLTSVCLYTLIFKLKFFQIFLFKVYSFNIWSLILYWTCFFHKFIFHKISFAFNLYWFNFHFLHLLYQFDFSFLFSFSNFYSTALWTTNNNKIDTSTTKTKNNKVTKRTGEHK